jgi:signal transduction histidine kinase
VPAAELPAAAPAAPTIVTVMADGSPRSAAPEGQAEAAAGPPVAPPSGSPQAGTTPEVDPVDTPVEAVGKIGDAVARTVTEPRILVTALTVALGLAALAAAGRQVPRYKRRQRRLLAQWDEASDLERENAERLAAASRQKSDFLALVSHELRTPLTAVKGFLDTVLVHWDRLPEEQRRELLARVSNNADELARLTNQLTQFARSDTGPVEVVPIELDVRTEVYSALRDLAPVVAQHRVEVDIPEHLHVLADRDGFGHVLVNLLTNAVKFSPPGSRVLVRAYSEDDEAVVYVEDEGPGISAAEQARVFDRFYQSRDALSQRGTGIGLTIAQRFTELHGGYIWVESEPGQGSTFAFTMPRAKRSPAKVPAYA